jgi:hypothetical protein
VLYAGRHSFNRLDLLLLLLLPWTLPHHLLLYHPAGNPEEGEL